MREIGKLRDDVNAIAEKLLTGSPLMLVNGRTAIDGLSGI